MLTKDAPSSSHTRDDSDAGVDPDCSNDQEVLEEAGSDYEPTYEETVAYARWLGIKPHEDIRMMRIAKEDGVQAFFTRGLSTRILANGLQSIVFSVVWRLLFDT